MGYISDQELVKARRNEANARLAFCAKCQTETPHLKPAHQGLLRLLNPVGAGRVCLSCGWQHVHRPVKSKRLRRAVYEADGYECVYCGRTNRLGLDHIIPQAHGGLSTFENLLTACHWCNTLRQEGRQQLNPRYGRYR